MDKGGRQETAETWSGNDGCGGGSWQQWTSTVADNNDGDGRQRQRQTTKAVDGDGTQDRAADYEGEGGEQVANNNGIRQKADKPAGQRAWKNKELKFTQQDFFSAILSVRWIFCSRKNSQCALFGLSVLFVQGKVQIPEGAEYKDQWERVICPTIQAKYVTIRCNLNNEIQRTYKSK